MKVIVVTANGGPQVLKLVEREDPVPTANQVLIKVRKASLNYADVQARKGTYAVAQSFPFIPGLDVMGTVLAVGENVHDLQKGQRVIAFPDGGSYAEMVVADRKLTFSLPDGISDEDAAAPVACGAALGVLTFAGRLQKGESVLIHSAAGGVGTVMVQLAKILGGAAVIATVGNDNKKDSVLSLGADKAINYHTENYEQQVMEFTQGRGIDLITNPIAGPLAERDLGCLADFGRLVVFGKGSGNHATFSTDDLHKRNRSVAGFSFGHIRKSKPAVVDEMVTLIFDFLTSRQLAVPVGSSFPLAEAAEAHCWLESRDNVGKVLLQMP